MKNKASDRIEFCSTVKQKYSIDCNRTTVLKYTAKSQDKEEYSTHKPVNRKEKQLFYFSIFVAHAGKLSFKISKAVEVQQVVKPTDLPAPWKT
jgi:hypothetical protein